MKPMTSVLVAAFALALAAREARAGNCVGCTSNADCLGGAGVCVHWLGTPPCAGLQESCCPGQACALNGNTPSCVGDMTCTVYTGGADAAPVDAAPGPDGMPANAAPPPAPGGGGGGDEGGGGGCRAGERPAAAASGILAL